VAREVHGLDARCGSLEGAGFEPAAFDLVTLVHVVEHLPDPRATLEAAVRLLRPGGTLVLVTPNFGSLDSRLHRDDWFPLDPPRHLFLFSPASIRRCVEALDGALSGMEVRACAAIARSTWGRSRLLRRERRRHGMRPGAPDERGYAWYKKVEGRLFNLVEHAANAFAPLGEELLLFARRA
jgi:SAM-dependent methyltransferase